MKLSQTKEALKKYDLESDKLSEMTSDNKVVDKNFFGVIKQLKVVEDCEKEVKVAYYNDTKSINSKETCMSLYIGPKEPQNPNDLCFVRKMVKDITIETIKVYKKMV